MDLIIIFGLMALGWAMADARGIGVLGRILAAICSPLSLIVLLFIPKKK